MLQRAHFAEQGHCFYFLKAIFKNPIDSSLVRLLPLQTVLLKRTCIWRLGNIFFLP